MSKEQRALQFMLDGNYEAAAKLFIELMEIEKEEPRHFMHFGKLLFQMKQYEEAERFFLKAISLDESQPEFFNSLGNLYYETKLYDDAIKMFQHTLKLGLDESDVHFMLGMSYVQNNNITLSLPYLQRSAELANEAEKLFQYGLSLAKLKYYEEATQQFINAIKLDDTHTDAIYNLAIIYVHKNELVLALQQLEKVLEQVPEHSLALQAKKEIEKLSR